MAFYVYEFLYRGVASGPGAWHVALAQDVTAPGGGSQTVTYPAMTPEQAASHGFTLDKILQGINADALAQVDAHKATADEATTKHDAAAAELEGVKTELAKTKADLATLQGQHDEAVRSLHDAQDSLSKSQSTGEALKAEVSTARADASRLEAANKTLGESRDAARADAAAAQDVAAAAQAALTAATKDAKA